MSEELSPRERRHQRTQQAILQAARALLAEGGAEKLSIRAIADRIDYSPAGLYEYFGSKEEIIGALAWEGHRTLRRYMARVPLSLAPADYLVELGMAYIQFAIQNPDYFLLIFTTGPLPPPPTDTVHREIERVKDEAIKIVPSVEMMNEDSSFPLLVNGVQRAVAQGVINYLSGLGALETSYAFWAIVHGAAMLRVSHLNYFNFDFDQADRLMLNAFVRGMGSQA